MSATIASPTSIAPPSIDARWRWSSPSSTGLPRRGRAAASDSPRVPPVTPSDHVPRSALGVDSEVDGSPTAVRRARLLRRHRRPRLQEDLPRAAGDGAARHARRAGHRRREGRAGRSSSSGRARARASTQHGGVDDERRSRSSCARLRYVDGDYHDPATFAALREALGERAAPGPLPRDPAEHVRDRRRGPRPVRAAPSDARVVVEKPFGRDLASAQRAERDAARGLRRVGDLPHRPLPRQGAGAEPAVLPLREHLPRADLEPQLRRRACRSRWPRASASRAAAGSTRRRARSATWSRTTCCRWWPASRWSRRPRRITSRSATRR